MKKRSIVLLIIGLIFIILPFIFNTYNILRLFSVMFGILLIAISVSLSKKNNILLIIVIPLVVFALTYACDILIFYAFKRMPVYVYELKSSDSVKNYNSFVYRIYSCNGNLIMDYGYQKKYACGNDDLEAIDINELLLNPQDSYTKYKNKFIRVHGKVSKITNLASLELSLWDTDDSIINGHVNFNSNYILKVALNDELKDIRIYEEVDVIGRITKLVDNFSTLYMVDAKLIKSDVYDTWNYEIVQNSDKTFKNVIDNYYYYGISELNIKYTDNLIYELSYLINDKKISVNDIIKGMYASNLYKDEELNITGEEYKLDKFNVLRCSNDKIIISNKKIKLDVNTCLLEDNNDLHH